MRKLSWIIFFLLNISSVHVSAQNWCDSTLAVCDSVSLDSIFFTHTFGDRVHVSMTSHHAHLYAPAFVLCPDDEDLELDRNHYDYFSLFGPASILPYYDFLNFEILGDSLRGRIILDNSNNGNESCEIGFRVLISQATGIIEGDPLQVNIFPNPAEDFLHFTLNEHDQFVQKIYVVNSFGQKQEVRYNSERIDLHCYPAGLYLVLFEFNDGSRLTRKVMVSK